jgi:hypothetical protein
MEAWLLLGKILSAPSAYSTGKLRPIEGVRVRQGLTWELGPTNV